MFARVWHLVDIRQLRMKDYEWMSDYQPEPSTDSKNISNFYLKLLLCQ